MSQLPWGGFSPDLINVINFTVYFLAGFPKQHFVHSVSRPSVSLDPLELNGLAKKVPHLHLKDMFILCLITRDLLPIFSHNVLRAMELITSKYPVEE